MFDVHRYERHQHNHTTTIKEQRAPTDESVRLLREMEQKARDSVLQSVRVKDCPVDAVVHVHEDLLNGRTLFKVIYQINGARREVDAAVEIGAEWQETAGHLIDALAKDIALTILAPSIRSALDKKL